MAIRTKNKTSLVERAYRGVLALLIKGELRSSDWISQRALAERFGMSKIPIAMAMKRLQQEGLMETVPYSGTRVCSVDAKEVWGMIQWRIGLECRMARLAGEWMTPDQVARLRQDAEELDRQCASPLFVDALLSDVKFHLTLADLCGCPLLRRELERLDIFRVKVTVCEVVAASVQTSPTRAPDHRDLIETLASGDPDKAEHCMRTHLELAPGFYGFLKWYQATYRPHR